MRGQDHTVLDDHVARFHPGIVQQRVGRGIGQIAGVAAENTAVMRLRPVGIADPVQQAVDEVDPAGFVTRVQGLRHHDSPVPTVSARIIRTSQPVAFVPLRAVAITRTGVEGVFRRVVAHVVKVAADDRIVRVAQQRAGSASSSGSVVPVVGTLTKRVRDFDRLTLIARVVDVDGGRAADHVAVVPPNQHLGSVHIPGVDARQAVEVPAGMSRILRHMGHVIRTIDVLDRDLAVRPQVVGAEVQFRQGAEQHIAVLQDTTEDDVTSIGKRDAVRPGATIVLGQQHFPLGKAERPIVTLRVDEDPFRLRPIPEMVGRSRRRPGRERLVASAGSPCQPYAARCRCRSAQEPAARHEWG